jgi:DNA (cytosine-5)-methyltransferase 1
VAGARRGIRSSQSSAFWGFERLLDRLGDRRPPLVLLENVVGFLTSHDGQDFADAMRAMTELGYAIDPILLDAAHFVPQSRPRLFIVCYSDSLPTADSLRPAARLPSPLRPAALLDSISRVRNVNWSARELPAPPTKGQKQLPEVLDELPDDSPQWWSTERSEYLLSQMSDRHRFIADAMIEKPGWSFGTVFRRVRKGRSMAELRVDGLAGCLRTPKGGSGRQILFKAGYGRFQVRLLNPDECARLMGAGGYRITVPPNQALMGFGDAVCADAVEWLARNYLNELIDAPGVGAAAQA